MAALERLARGLLAEDAVGAGVPHDHLAGAVLALGDHALEVAVGERVVFGRHGEPLLARVERRPLRYRPRLEHAVGLEPEVVVQARRRVLLDHEARLAAPSPAPAASVRLRGLGEVALGPEPAESARAAHRTARGALVRNVALMSSSPCSATPSSRRRRIASRAGRSRSRRAADSCTSPASLAASRRENDGSKSRLAIASPFIRR